jgi:hypothetical protein
MKRFKIVTRKCDETNAKGEEVKTIRYPLIVGGYHDGQRIEAPANADFQRLPAYPLPCSVGYSGSENLLKDTITLYDYRRTEFVAGGFLFTFFVPTGQDGAVTLRKLLDGYNPKVTPK